MDNISVSSTSTYSKNTPYSKKVQMIMTSSDNPMINFEKVQPAAGNSASMRQRGLLSQIAYLPTSSQPAVKPSTKTSKQCKTVSGISSLPGAFIVGAQEESPNKKLFKEHKNRTTFDLPEEQPKKSKTYYASKLDHQLDVLQNVIYDEEPVGKKSIHSTANKLEHKFDIFGGETKPEIEPKSAKAWRGDKLEHHYDIFKQYEPVNS
jgi:hypothetical protein